MTAAGMSIKIDIIPHCKISQQSVKNAGNLSARCSEYSHELQSARPAGSIAPLMRLDKLGDERVK
jgi:hypothetical protein